MKLWSRGLGKTEIYMDFRHYKTLQDPKTKEIIIVGSMQSPVTWEFKITMQPEDIGGMMKAFFHPRMLIFVAKNLYQYIVYLMNKNKYVKKGEDVVAKVTKAYDQIINSGRKKLLQNKRDVA